MKLRLVSSLILATSLASAAWAQKLEDPILSLKPGQQIRVTDTDAFERFRETKIIEAAEQWRGRALSSVRATGEASSTNDLQLLMEAAYLKAGPRVLKQEFLEALPAQRVAALFVEARKDKNEGISAAQSRYDIAKFVELSPDLVELHDDARYERLCMTLVLSRDHDFVLESFRSEEARGFSRLEAGERIRSAVAALSNPQQPQDYEQSLFLLDTTTQYWSRLQSGWLVSPVLKQIKNDGVESFGAAVRGGSYTPLRAAVRASFEMDQQVWLNEFLSHVERNNAPTDVVVEVRYWTATGLHARAEYPEAIALFEKNIQTGSASSFMAWSAFRAGESCLMNRNNLNAAVYFLDAKDMAGQNASLRKEAVRYYSTITSSSTFNTDQFHAALAARLNARSVAFLQTSEENR